MLRVILSVVMSKADDGRNTYVAVAGKCRGALVDEFLKAATARMPGFEVVPDSLRAEAV